MAIDTHGTISPEQPPVGGSIFTIGNTTYSGCDIKVVVNVYDDGRGVDAEINKIATAIKNVEADIRDAADNIGPATTKLLTYKRGTPEFLLAQVEANTYIKLIALRQETLVELQQRHDQLLHQKNRNRISTKVLAEIQTLSASVARDKTAVRACGSVYPKAFTRGPREIAGSMVFTVFNEDVLYDLMEAHASDFDGVSFTSALLDQLPPLDITVSFANEYGSVSRMGIYGVEFQADGQIMSIEDMITERTVNYVARDIDPMRSVATPKFDEVSAQLGREQGVRASDLLLEDDYKELKNSVSPWARFNRRRDPFV